MFCCIFSLLRVILKAFVIAVTTYESMLISYSEVDIIQNMNNLLRAKPTVLPITTSQPLNVKQRNMKQHVVFVLFLAFSETQQHTISHYNHATYSFVYSDERTFDYIKHPSMSFSNASLSFQTHINHLHALFTPLFAAPEVVGKSLLHDTTALE